ncbi:MAG: hypothetical protein IPK16_23990 [Anaerolineales bacterium]|nr:hypothetical protein [Anaerolineales bacterium]
MPAPETPNPPSPDQTDRQIRRYWLAAIAFSLLCTLLIIVLIARSMLGAPLSRSNQTIINSPEELTEYEAAYQRFADAEGWGKLQYVPTGVYVKSLEFTGPYNVRATGYVWQRYGKDIPPDVRRGVVFPEAEKPELTEAYRIKQGEEELIGWYFVLNLREQFDYSRYPFDQQDVWFRLWHPDFVSNVVLVPDLKAYPSLNHADLPGVEQGIVLEGWDLTESFFSYRPITYTTNFGFYETGVTASPDLYFNVGVQREILTPLLTQGVSPLVVLMLVFVTFLFFTRDHERRGAFGLSWSGVIGVWSGLFFATLVAQSGLRNQVKSESFVYLESLHILLYPLILVVATVTTIVVVYPGFKILKYHDNVVPKLLYWPIVTSILLIATIILFR